MRTLSARYMNIRDVPEELHRKLKSDAASHGVTLNEWVLTLLRNGRTETASGRNANRLVTHEEVTHQTSKPLDGIVHAPGCRCAMCASKKSEHAPKVAKR